MTDPLAHIREDLLRAQDWLQKAGAELEDEHPATRRLWIAHSRLSTALATIERARRGDSFIKTGPADPGVQGIYR